MFFGEKKKNQKRDQKKERKSTKKDETKRRKCWKKCWQKKKKKTEKKWRKKSNRNKLLLWKWDEKRKDNERRARTRREKTRGDQTRRYKTRRETKNGFFELFFTFVSFDQTSFLMKKSSLFPDLLLGCLFLKNNVLESFLLKKKKPFTIIRFFFSKKKVSQTSFSEKLFLVWKILKILLNQFFIYFFWKGFFNLFEKFPFFLSLFRFFYFFLFLFGFFLRLPFFIKKKKGRMGGG